MQGEIAPPASRIAWWATGSIHLHVKPTPFTQWPGGTIWPNAAQGAYVGATSGEADGDWPLGAGEFDADGAAEAVAPGVADAAAEAVRVLVLDASPGV